MTEIVAEAGISKGLFYHYYENKKQLYLHIYDTYTAVLSKFDKYIELLRTEVDYAIF